MNLKIFGPQSLGFPRLAVHRAARLLLAAALSVCTLLSVYAQTTAPKPSPAAMTQLANQTAAKSIVIAPALKHLPSPPLLAAKSYVLFDLSTQDTLAEYTADEAVEPASLTKLMTAYLTFEALEQGKLQLQQKLPISPRARAMQGSRMFVESGWQVPVEDLLKGLIVQSGNDAAVALAEGVGGSVEQFVGQMNAKAQQLGMAQTRYLNPEGLTVEGHKTSARDLTRLAVSLLTRFNAYTHLYALKTYRYEGTPASNDTNRNRLLFTDSTVDGLKTGHTDAAGYCLIATAQRSSVALLIDPSTGQHSTPQLQRRLISVVLGTVSEAERAKQSAELLNWGYAQTVPVVWTTAGQSLGDSKRLRVWQGSPSNVALKSAQPVAIAMGAGAKAPKMQVLHAQPYALAPLAADALVAQAQILDGALTGSPRGAVTLLKTIPLQPMQAVPEAFIVKRWWDAGLLAWKKLRS